MCLSSTFFTPSHAPKFSCSVALGYVGKPLPTVPIEAKAESRSRRNLRAQTAARGRFRLWSVRKRFLSMLSHYCFCPNYSCWTNILKKKSHSCFSEPLRAYLYACELVLLCCRKCVFRVIACAVHWRQGSTRSNQTNTKCICDSKDRAGTSRVRSHLWQIWLDNIDGGKSFK